MAPPIRPVPLATPSRGDVEPRMRPSRQPTVIEVEDEPASSIETVIQHCLVLKEALANHRDRLGALQAELASQNAECDALRQEIATIEHRVGAEGGRANTAERYAATTEAAARALEQTLATLEARANRLVNAVTCLMPDGNDLPPR